MDDVTPVMGKKPSLYVIQMRDSTSERTAFQTCEHCSTGQGARSRHLALLTERGICWSYLLLQRACVMLRGLIGICLAKYVHR